MPVRDSWAVGSDTDRRVDVEDARLALGALWTPSGTGIGTRAGFRPGPTMGEVTASAPTADVSVHVAPFQYVAPTSRGVGPYVWTLDSAYAIDVLTAHPADSANPRRDLIVAQQNDAFYGDTSSTMAIRQVVGVASATPTDPAITGSPDYLILARVTVRAGATAVTSSDITDLRPTPLHTVAAGGILTASSAGGRPSSPWEGMTVYRSDWDWLEVWDGAAWRVRGVATASSLSALQTGVSDPYDGQVAILRDTLDSMYVYNAAGGWKLRTVEPDAIWVTCPNQGTGVGTVNFNRVRRLCTGQVEWQYASGANANTSGKTLTTLPLGYRPTVSGFKAPFASNTFTDNYARVDIGTDGVVAINIATAAPTTIGGVVTFTP